MKMWIARDMRDMGRDLYLYTEKPEKIALYGYFTGDDWFELNTNAFPEVTFENSPMEVELKLIEK